MTQLCKWLAGMLLAAEVMCHAELATSSYHRSNRKLSVHVSLLACICAPHAMIRQLGYSSWHTVLGAVCFESC